MTATLVAAPAGPEDDDERQVIDRVLCRCGRLASVVFDMDAECCWCSVACVCGAFSPADAEVGS
jgi:hypothetical protein